MKELYPTAEVHEHKIDAGNTVDHLPDTQDDGYFDDHIDHWGD